MSSMGLSRVAAAALLVGSAACLSTTSDSPATPAPTPTPQTLNGALAGALLETGAPGGAAAIVREGALVFEGASGDAARSPVRPLRATSLFSLVGVTEMATAALVLRLAEQGQLGLDDALERYARYVPGADRITVGMLLAHRSGLPDYLSPSFGEIVGGFADPAHAWTREEILRAIDPDDDVRPPGEAYRYSQTDYVALGAVLEQASGTPVDALFKQIVAGPLGLERCLFDRDPALAPDVAHGFAYDGARSDYVSLFPANGSVPTFLWGPVWTDNGIMCTAGDAARFTDALFRGRVVSPDSLALMTRFGAESYGHGVARKTDTGHLLHGHAGARPGYGAAAWYDPEARLTIVALVNADGPGFLAGTLHQRMDEAYRRGSPP